MTGGGTWNLQKSHFGYDSAAVATISQIEIRIVCEFRATPQDATAVATAGQVGIV